MENSSTPVQGAASGGAPERYPLRPVELAGIFAFWTLIAILSAANGLLDPRRSSLPALFPAAPVALAFLASWLWAAITLVMFVLADRFSRERGYWVARGIVLALIVLVVAILVDTLLAYARYVIMPLRPRGAPELNVLVRASRFWFLNQFIVVTGMLAAGFARHFFLRYQARQVEAARLAAQLADARLAALRSQLDPHFLFNTLHAVSALVERDPRGVRRMIARLSELLRATLEGAHEQEVPLSAELAFLERYLDIMRIRFQGRLEATVRVEPGLEDALVPNLVLQPLVENALKHGVGQIEGPGLVEIDARRDGDAIVLSVADNGPPATMSTRRDVAPATAVSQGAGPAPAGAIVGAAAGEGIGLRNTRERLAALYGTMQSLELRARAEGGRIAEVRLPYHTRADLRAIAVHDEAGQ